MIQVRAHFYTGEANTECGGEDLSHYAEAFWLYTKAGKTWKEVVPPTDTYQPNLAFAADLDGDGRPEVFTDTTDSDATERKCFALTPDGRKEMSVAPYEYCDCPC